MAIKTQTWKPLQGSDKYTDTTIVTKGAFANGSGTLLGKNMWTSSFTTATSESKLYFHGIMDGHPASASSNHIFDVAFGNVNGSGSKAYKYASQEIYNTMRQTLLFDPYKKFNFPDVGSTSGRDVDNIYVLSLKKDYLADGVSTGWTMVLSGCDGCHGTGSQPLHLTTLEENKETWPSRGGQFYKVVSGSDGVRTSVTASKNKVYGAFWPEQGIVVLDAAQLTGSGAGSIAAGVRISGSTSTDNRWDIDRSSEGVGGIGVQDPSTIYDPRPILEQVDHGGHGNALKMYGLLRFGSLKMRVYEYKNSKRYYCRIHHNDYTATSNPTWLKSGSTTNEFTDEFQKFPVTYISEVLLYNSNNDLIAVANLDTPQPKSPNSELIINVTLDI